MKQFLLLLTLLLSVSQASAQLEVSMGYLVPTSDELGYGKAYLSVGQKFGAGLVIGGDSRISYGGEKQGRGWTGGHVWYDVQHEERDSSFKFFAGIEGAESWERIDELANPVQSGFYNPQRLTSVEMKPYAGLAIGWKFLELTITSALEAGIGIKLNR